MAKSFYALRNINASNKDKLGVKTVKSVLDVVKNFDPSGIAGIISAYMKENCYYDGDFEPFVPPPAISHS